MNRQAVIDSGNSLDAESRVRESALMIVQPYRLYVERTDAAANMARFYAMSIEPTLFGDVCLVRRWGSTATAGLAEDCEIADHHHSGRAGPAPYSSDAT